MIGTEHTPPKDFAFYYPDIGSCSPRWIKNAILYFDGVALLIPRYSQDRFLRTAPDDVSELLSANLLQVIEPERAVDKQATETLALAMTEIIASGRLDSLPTDAAFRRLSASPAGFSGDPDLAQMIFEELKKRNLARNSDDDVSIYVHRMVEALYLTLHSQILRPYGRKYGLDLNPTTDAPRLVEALGEMFALPHLPSAGDVVSFDVNAVGINLEEVPLDEILAFRREHGAQFADYRTSLRKFTCELGRMAKGERELAFEIRQKSLDEMASQLKKASRSLWKKPASFLLGISGAAWSYLSGDPAAAVLGGLGALLTASESEKKPDTGAYSYLFDARDL